MRGFGLTPEGQARGLLPTPLADASTAMTSAPKVRPRPLRLCRQSLSRTPSSRVVPLVDSVANTRSFVVSCQHGEGEASEKGDRRCLARRRGRGLDSDCHAVRASLGRNTVWRIQSLGMPDVDLVHAPQRRYSRSPGASLHCALPARATSGERRGLENDHPPLHPDRRWTRFAGRCGDQRSVRGWMRGMPRLVGSMAFSTSISIAKHPASMRQFSRRSRISSASMASTWCGLPMPGLSPWRISPCASAALGKACGC